MKTDKEFLEIVENFNEMLQAFSIMVDEFIKRATL